MTAGRTMRPSSGEYRVNLGQGQVTRPLASLPEALALLARSTHNGFGYVQVRDPKTGAWTRVPRP